MTDLKLEIRRPGKDPEFYTIKPGIYTIGADEDCRIQLNSDTVEGRHAILTVREEGCWIEDLGSADGTKVDGIPVGG